MPIDEPHPAWKPPLAGDVCIVAFPLTGDPDEVALHEAMLSVGERDRAARMAPAVGGRFVAARGRLRRLLARVLDDAPEAIEFVVGAQGKPALGGRHAGRCEFNLSHSRDRCLVALSATRAVGVDLEVPGPTHTVAWAALLAGSILSAGELAAHRLLADAERPRRLLEAWVAKEAVLKATGRGIAGGVRHLAIPERVPRPRLVADSVACAVDLAAVPGAAPGTWGVCLLDLDDGGVAAVSCAAGADGALDCRVASVSVERFGIEGV